jgi:hypothetical protein
MHVAKSITTVIAGITVGAGVFGTGTASAETPFAIEGASARSQPGRTGPR